MNSFIEQLLAKVNLWLKPVSAAMADQAYATEAKLFLAFLIATVAVALVVVWLLFRPPQSWLAKLLSTALLMALALLPGYVYVMTYKLGLGLFTNPMEIWVLWHFNSPKLLGPEMQHRLAATSALFMMALGLVVALLSPKKVVWRALAFAALALLSALPLAYAGKAYGQKKAVQADFDQGKALFDLRCQSAGVSRLAQAIDLDGIRLDKLRAEAGESRDSDREWADAGMPGDRVGQAYIASFLDFYFDDSDVNHPGWSTGLTGRVTMHGFKYVDVAQPDGSFLRHRLAGTTASGPLVTEVIPASEAARYAVSYLPTGSPEDRQHWVAGATVTVTDTMTHQVIGELKAFSFVPPPRRQGADLQDRFWYSARTCPAYKDIPGVMVRMFVESVVAPSR